MQILSRRFRHLRWHGGRLIRRHAPTIRHCGWVFVGYTLLYVAFFAPVLFSGKLLAPSDGVVYYLPAFYSPPTLWTDLIFGGYPVMADIQNMNWYPPAMFLRLIPGGWNIFVLMAYVLAGCFAYCYAYLTTRSRLAGIVTGLVYSMSGFMMAHVGHITMVHAAAWLPLLMCAIEQLRHRFTRGWWFIGAVAMACCLLGGHPQMAVYTLGVGSLYALILGGQSNVGRWRYYATVLGMLAVGLSLCAIQILPTIELSQLSQRATMTFQSFITFSLPRREILQLLFPYFFGVGLAAPYGLYESAYWGTWNLSETTGYIGFMPLILAVIGLLRYPKRGLKYFWAGLGLVAFLLAFGDDMGLGWWLYQVPIYNKFRAQGRHFVEFSFAISVLSGFGIVAIQRRWASQRLIQRLIIIMASLMAVVYGLVWLKIDDFRLALAKVADVQRETGQVVANLPGVLPWRNPAVGVPLVLFCCGLLGLWLWSRRTQLRWTRQLLLMTLVLELGSFGWFWEWQTYAPDTQLLQPVPVARDYQQRLKPTHQRLFRSAKGASMHPEVVYPNMTRLWKLPNMSGYSPLVLERVSRMVGVRSSGSLLRPIPAEAERGLDLMAVKYVFLAAPPAGSRQRPGVAWLPTDLDVTIGKSACVPPTTSQSAEFNFEDLDYEVSEIHFVSMMGCAVSIPDQTTVAEITVTDRDGQVEKLPLLAGRDTAETAWDCPRVKPNVQHQRATIFREFPRPTCQAYQYLSRLPLQRSHKLSRVKIDWTDADGVMHIRQVSLGNRSKQTSVPVFPTDIVSRWQIHQQGQFGAYYENPRAQPRAWLVPTATAASPDAILQTIHTSRLPDGQIYDPNRVALVEDTAGTLQSTPLQANDRVEVATLEAQRMVLNSEAAAPTFLVVSDVFYPGWKATIDGQPTKIFQTNYAQRGVKLPPGKHVVEFRFEPMSFRIGAGLTLLVACGSAYFVLFGVRQSSQRR